MESFFPAFLIVSSPSKNQTKTSPKADHFGDWEFFSAFPTTTYNFNTLKRSDFIPLVAQLSGTCQLTVTPRSRSARRANATNSLQSRAGPCKLRQGVGTPRRRRPPSKPLFHLRSGGAALPMLCGKSSANKLAKYCTQPDKTGRFTTSIDFEDVVPTTYDDTPSGRPVFQNVPMIVTDYLLNSGLPRNLRSGRVFIVPIP
jgi:hypothetical protein